MDSTITVINPDDQKPIQIRSEDLNSALKEGATLVPQVSKSDLDGNGNAFVIDPQTQKSISVPLEKLPDALRDGGRLSSTYDPNRTATFKNTLDKSGYAGLEQFSPSIDKIQDPEGKYLLKDGNGNIFHLDQDEALKQVASNHLHFADPDFQAMIDARRSSSDEKGIRNLSAVVKGVAEGVPIIGPLVDKVSNYLTKETNYVPGKAIDISAKLNREQEGTSENTAGDVGKTIGTIGSTAAALINPVGLMGEGLAAAKLGSLAEGAASAAEFSPLATKALTGAATGLGYSLPFVADQLINNDPQKAAETTLISMGIGTLLHAAPIAFNSVLGARVANASAKLPEAADAELGHMNISGVPQEQASPFVRDILKQSPKLEDVGQSLKNLAAGDHLIPTLSKLDADIPSQPIISKLEQLGFKTGTSEDANNALNNIIKQLNPIENKISLTNLQKVNKDLVQSIDFGSKVPDEINNIKIQALDHIHQSLVEGADSSLAKAVSEGNPKAVQLTKELETGKNSMGTAKDLLADYQASGNTAPELTSLGKVVRNIGTNAFAGAEAGISNKAAYIGNHISLPIPVIGTVIKDMISTVTGSKGVMSGAISNVVSNRGAAFDTWIAAHPNTFLVKNINSNKIGTFAALDAIASNNAKLGEIPDFIKDISGKVPAVYRQNKDPISKALGAESVGLSKEQQLNRLSEKVAMLAGNPDLAQQRVNSLIHPFVEDHPQMALATQRSAHMKIAYLNQLLHGQNNQDPAAFQAQPKQQWTKTQINDIKSQLAAIDNPYGLLHGLANGTVSANQVQAVAATSPTILKEIQDAIHKQAYTGEAKLNYQQRLSASLITGQPLDGTLKNVPMLQMSFGAAQQQQPQGNPKKAGHKLDSDQLPTHQTTAQRIQSQ
jgi:hypothetical protein